MPPRVLASGPKPCGGNKTKHLKKYGTVHHIRVEQYGKEYVGESSRALETRVQKHVSKNSSAVDKVC